MAAPLYIPSLLIDQVINALAVFIAPFLGNPLPYVPTNSENVVPIIRAQVNRVSMPITGFVELRELFEIDLETPTFVNTWSFEIEAQQGMITTPTRIDIQMDFYGPSAGDWCKAVKTVFRTDYAVSQFPDGMVPLYCSDGTQAPLITGEAQYENHWILTATLQYNPSVSVPLQSATTLETNIFEDLP